MNIRIVTSAKLNKEFVRQGVEEYTKRLSRYCKLSFKSVRRPEDASRMIKGREVLILVNDKGKSVSSEYLAEYINSLGIKGRSDLFFLLTPRRFNSKGDLHISLTNMDMDIQLLIQTLYEQIYRPIPLYMAYPTISNRGILKGFSTA